MDQIRPVTSGAPSSEGAPGGARPRPSCSGAPAGATRPPSPSCTTPPRRRVFGLALRVVRDPAQAEEVTQEAFLEIWRTSARFDPDRGSALAWLLTIVHRKAVDRVRSAEASTRRDTTYHQGATTVEHDTTAEAAEASLEARRVRGALRTLTEVQREALELAYFGGYTHTEVATMLDLPVGTAKTRIRDGLIRLRDAMGVGAA